MHIKSITISGFRSYRDQTFPEGLSPKHNVVVGRNGSGKSNFFAAIQFVLSEKFSNLRAAERKDLLHAGAGRQAMSAFVEIVFDNSEGRLVIPGRSEAEAIADVSIRRTVGTQKDEFRVNNKQMPESDVRQLLESAGFSSSNPYYIVEQGKIVNLASMKEDDRYHLIKEVAGTKVYEARKAESEVILTETRSKRAKIDESIQQLDDRLKELEAEQKELRQYQELDRKRRSLEYCVYNSEMQQVAEEGSRMEEEWASKVRTVTTHRDEQANIAEDIKAMEQAAAQCTKRIAALELERRALEKDRAALVSRKAEAEIRAGDVAGARKQHDLELKALQKEQKELEKEIQNGKKELDSRRAAKETKTVASAKLADELGEKEGRLEFLQAKRGRKGQFKSKAERDVWIKEGVARNENILDSNKKELDRLAAENKKLLDSIKAEEDKVAKLSSDVKKQDAAGTGSDKRRSDLNAQRDSLNKERRKMWQTINEQEGVVRRLTEEVDRWKNKLSKSVRQDIRQGYESVKEVLAELNDPAMAKAVHGQVIDLLEVSSKHYTAVEITAGNALFNVVVDSFDVSAKILDHMNRRKKPGRITFFPLDTCKSTPRDLPTNADVSPLLSHVKFESKFKAVAAELFGRTLVASSVEAGASAVKQYDCDTITLDGDQFSRKGGIYGGYIDTKGMKLVTFAQLHTAQAQLAKERATLDGSCKEVAVVEQKIAAAVQELEAMNSQDQAHRSAAENERLEIRQAEDHVARAKQQLALNEAAAANIQRSTNQTKSSTKALKEELNADFKATLSTAEEAEMERLHSQLADARTVATKNQSEATRVTTDVQLLEDTISHMQRRLGNVRDRVVALEQENRSAVGDQLQGETKRADEELGIVDKRLQEVDTAIENATKERQKHEESADTAHRKVQNQSRNFQDEKDSLDRQQNQRALLLQKKEEIQAKIKRLGPLPPDAAQYSGHSVAKLMSTMKTVNEDLKKYSHVNKKALDQFTELVDTRDTLHTRRDGLDSELESIHKLMSHLDEQKDEAIERTYKQVQFQFESVFTELVTAEGASAALELVKSKDKKSSDKFSAVKINVSFGMGGAVSELSQLSGGQKSLVALALIFAIQRSDPAPFYLFDEIDAALDAEYRTAVANLLQKESANCQFITATFKTEMLNAADRVYGIFFQNKVSRIQQVTMDEGNALLRLAAQDEKKRGRDGDPNPNTSSP